MKPVIDYNKPESAYHGDPASFSQTEAKRLLQSPLKYLYEKNNPSSTRAKDLGSFAHALVLGQDTTSFYKKDWDGNWNTIKGREGGLSLLVSRFDVDANDFIDSKGGIATHTVIQAEIAKRGLIELTSAEWDAAHGMADSVFSHPEAAWLLSDGRAEVSMYADCPRTGVRMRGRVDWLRNDGLVVDLKTARDSSESGFRTACQPRSYDYPLQAAWYTELATMNGIDVSDFVFVVVDKKAPYVVGIYNLSEATMRAAAQRGLKARRLYKHYQLTDEWPHTNNGGGIVTLDIKDWDAVATLA